MTFGDPRYALGRIIGSAREAERRRWPGQPRSRFDQSVVDALDDYRPEWRDNER